MSKSSGKESREVEQFLNENLRVMFNDFSDDTMPSEISDLLRVLKAQDEALKAKK